MSHVDWMIRTKQLGICSCDYGSVDALFKIFSGEEQDPTTSFAIYGSTLAHEPDPLFADIEFEWDIEGHTGRFAAITCVTYGLYGIVPNESLPSRRTWCRPYLSTEGKLSEVQLAITGVDKRLLELLQVVNRSELGEFVDYVLRSVDENTHVCLAQHACVIVGISGGDYPVVEAAQGFYRGSFGVFLTQFIVHYIATLVDQQAVAEKRRPLQLSHQRLGEFVESVRQDNHLKTLA